MNVTALKQTPDPIGQCEREIAAAIDRLEAATGQQVSLLDLLYTDADGNHGQFCGQTHRCVMLALDAGPRVEWARGAA